jgi:hypothetical protein
LDWDWDWDWDSGDAIPGAGVLFLFLFLSRAALFVCARRESRGEKATAGGNGCVASDFFSFFFLPLLDEGRGRLMLIQARI